MVPNEHGHLEDESQEARDLIRDIATTPRLTREEEVTLATRMWWLRDHVQPQSDETPEQARQRVAYDIELNTLRTQFFASNIRLVISVVNEMSRRSWMDMFQDGSIGLMRAIDLFDPARGTAFSTYAVTWIKKMIQVESDRHESTIRLPSHVRDERKRVDRTARRLEVELGKAPSTTDIAKTLNMPAARLSTLLARTRQHLLSIDEIQDSLHTGDDLADLYTAQEERRQSQHLVRLAIDDVRVVDPLGAAILKARFGLGAKQQTMVEIGRVLGEKSVTVRQLCRRALRTALALCPELYRYLGGRMGIPLLFVRIHGGSQLVKNEVTPGCEWVVQGLGKATLLFDGLHCLVQNETLYKAHLMKSGKTDVEFIPVGEYDHVAKGQPGWLPVSNTKSVDQWYREACKDNDPYWCGKPDGEYFLIGPKINGNHHHRKKHVLMSRGGVSLADKAPRTWDNLKTFFASPDGAIYGIEWADGDRRACIHRNNFDLPWPATKR